MIPTLPSEVMRKCSAPFGLSMVKVLSAAFAVVTVSVPVREPAAISPTNPVTTSFAEPISVNVVFCASAVALTVTVSVLKLLVIEVAADPVVIDVLSSGASPVVTVSAPVRDPARVPG